MKCDCCGRTIDKNYGDAYSYLCANCAGVFMTGNKAKEYIETKGATMESVWKFKTDGKTGIYRITFHNELMQVIFEKVPAADTEVEIKIKEN